MKTEGWESLLNDHISEAYKGGFQWGQRDCALWCADWVLKATARDLQSEWLGRYKTEKGAAMAMRRRGFTNAEAIADAQLLSCPVTLAQRGDIMLNEQGCLGICNGRHSYFLTADGVLMHPTLQCAKAWKIE